jgi:glutamate racemase
MNPAAPIGVFDSGVGGLSVLAELRRSLPHEDFVYLADTAHLPYGARPGEEIRELTARAVTQLHARGVKAVVVACNTASAYSLEHLRARFDLPVIGLVPAVKPAVAATRSGVVGVLATPGTLRGTLLQQVIHEFADPAGVQVLTAVSADLVPLVEAGQADSARTRTVLRETLAPLAQAGADTLVLGCTHYPFLTGSIRAEFGETFALLDSGAAVARHTHRVLLQAGLLGGRGTVGTVTYLVTGDVEAARPVIAALAPDPPTAAMGHNGPQTSGAGSSSGALPRIERMNP